MWPFSRKYTLHELGAMNGFADHHSHLLPGVDDGAHTLEDSLDALLAYEQEGVDELWLTPHIMEDYPNETADLRARFSELCKAYEAQAGEKPIRLHLAAEHMLDTLFTHRLASNDLLTLTEYKHLLVETSYFNPPADLYGILERIASAGYRAVLAHPERYLYMERSDYERLIDMGVLLQLNLASPAGGYGPEAAARADYLLKKEAYSLIGSDIHSLRSTMAAIHRPIKSSVAERVINLINNQRI